MNKLITLMAFTVLFSSSVFAGFSNPVPVTIDLENRTAMGDMTAARLSENEFMLIGCGTRTFSDGSFSFELGFCQAGIEEGVTQLCLTQDPLLITAIRGTTDYSFITFSWNENGDCIRIGQSSQSFYLRFDKHTVKDAPKGK